MPREVKEYPDCECFVPMPFQTPYAVENFLNYCRGNEPYSCRRARKEGLCSRHPIRKRRK